MIVIKMPEKLIRALLTMKHSTSPSLIFAVLKPIVISGCMALLISCFCSLILSADFHGIFVGSGSISAWLGEWPKVWMMAFFIAWPSACILTVLLLPTLFKLASKIYTHKAFSAIFSSFWMALLLSGFISNMLIMVINQAPMATWLATWGKAFCLAWFAASVLSLFMVPKLMTVITALDSKVSGRPVDLTV